MRKAEELEMTAQPAAANLGSSSRAMGASMEEKMMRGSSLASFGRVGLEDHLRDARGEGRVEAPVTGLGVGLAGAAVAGGEPGDVEPGMIREKLDESLTDHSGRAENAYVTPFHLVRIARGNGVRQQVSELAS